jgi:hypothetical protein
MLQAEVKAEMDWKPYKFLSPQNMSLNLLALKTFHGHAHWENVESEMAPSLSFPSQ